MVALVINFEKFSKVIYETYRGAHGGYSKLCLLGFLVIGTRQMKFKVKINGFGKIFRCKLKEQSELSSV